MSYPTRRARIEAEKASLRSRRRRSLTGSVAGLATIAGAAVAGIAPATANEAAYSTPTSTNQSSQQSWTWDGHTHAQDRRSSSSDASTSSGPAIERTSSITPMSSTGTGWGTAVQWAIDKANDPSVYYSWGGNGPTAYDCSGFTKSVFAQAGVDIPRTSKTQYAAAQQYVSLDNLQVGDLVFWSNNGSASGIYHVAVYIGDGQIAHARNPQMGVAVTAVDYSPYNMMGTAARY